MSSVIFLFINLVLLVLNKSAKNVRKAYNIFSHPRLLKLLSTTELIIQPKFNNRFSVGFLFFLFLFFLSNGLLVLLVVFFCTCNLLKDFGTSCTLMDDEKGCNN